VINALPVLPLYFNLSPPSRFFFLFSFYGSSGLSSAEETIDCPLVPTMSNARVLSLFPHRPVFSPFLSSLSSIFRLHPSQLSGAFRWPPLLVDGSPRSISGDGENGEVGADSYSEVVLSAKGSLPL
jgi:hypothetical protein